MVKFSIIVPVYQAEKYLRECIDSLLEQTYKNLELILVDDGSTDKSRSICDYYRQIDNRVKLITQKNAGVSVARNAGLNIASGDWVMFVDSDDWVDKDMCKFLNYCIEEKELDIVMFSHYCCKLQKKEEAQLVKLQPGDVSQEKSYIEKKIITQYYDSSIGTNGVSAGTCWGKAVRMDIIKKYNIKFVPGLIRAQDTVFWLNTFEVSNNIYYLNKPLYYYRINESSITAGKKYIPDSIDRFGALLEEYNNFIVKYNKDESFMRALYIRTIQVLYWNFLHNICNKQNRASIHKKIRLIKSIVHNNNYSLGIRMADLRTLPKRQRVIGVLCRFRLYYFGIMIFCYIERQT